MLDATFAFFEQDEVVVVCGGIWRGRLPKL